MVNDGKFVPAANIVPTSEKQYSVIVKSPFLLCFFPLGDCISGGGGMRWWFVVKYWFIWYRKFAEKGGRAAFRWGFLNNINVRFPLHPPFLHLPPKILKNPRSRNPSANKPSPKIKII